MSAVDAHKLPKPAAFVVVHRPGLPWAIPAEAVTRITRGDDPALPDSLILVEELAQTQGGELSDFLHALIVRTDHGERSIRLGGRIDLVSAEGLSIEPIPNLCRTALRGALTLSGVALSDDEIKFMILVPAI